MTAAREEKPDAAPEPRAAPGTVHRAPPSSQRNWMLAVVLVSIALSVFVTVVVAAVLFHYAEINHAIPGF